MAKDLIDWRSMWGWPSWIKWLGLIVLLGLGLRLVNISAYKIYPDSYQSLLVAQNIAREGQVVGTLGEGGVVFPDTFMWTRPTYPLLIGLVGSWHLTVGNEVRSAQLVNLIAGVGSIIVCYFLIRVAGGNKQTALIGSLLVASSFNLVVWGGFVLTEAVGVFTLLLWLTAIMRKKYFYAGILGAVAILSRYEYAVMLIPLVIWCGKKSWRVLVPMVLVLVTVGWLLFDIPLTIVQFAAAGPGLFNVAEVVHKVFTWQGIWDFWSREPLLVVGLVMGIPLLWRKNKRLLFGLGVGAALLESFYWRTNPEMARYWTHLWPLVVVPGAVGMAKLFNTSPLTPPLIYGRGKTFLLILVVLYQILISWMGLKNLNGGEWLRSAYEQDAAVWAANKMTANNHVVLSMLPEVYYYFSGLPNTTLATEYPYVWVDQGWADKQVYIVSDMAMATLTPQFNQFVTDKLADKLIGEYWTHKKYHYGGESQAETQPIRLYELPLMELRKRIFGNIKQD